MDNDERYSMTTAQAAEALDLSRDAVIKACLRGPEFGLDAIKVSEPGRGEAYRKHRGLWLIDPASVETYKSRRRTMRGW